MSEKSMSLEETKKECEKAAIALANQADASRDLDSLMKEKDLESMRTRRDASRTPDRTNGGQGIDTLRARFEAERRMNRADAIENLECLARLLEGLPSHDFGGYKMSGFGNYPSRTIYAAVEVLKKNN